MIEVAPGKYVAPDMVTFINTARGGFIEIALRGSAPLLVSTEEVNLENIDILINHTDSLADRIPFETDEGVIYVPVEKITMVKKDTTKSSMRPSCLIFLELSNGTTLTSKLFTYDEFKVRYRQLINLG